MPRAFAMPYGPTISTRRSILGFFSATLIASAIFTAAVAPTPLGPLLVPFGILGMVASIVSLVVSLCIFSNLRTRAYATPPAPVLVDSGTFPGGGYGRGWGYTAVHAPGAWHGHPSQGHTTPQHRHHHSSRVGMFPSPSAPYVPGYPPPPASAPHVPGHPPPPAFPVHGHG